MNHHQQYLENSPSIPESQKRHDREITRRLDLLQYRRERLTHELNAINSALLSLTQQIQQRQNYKQLTL